MIANVLGRFWGNEEVVNLRDNLPEGFELKLYNMAHKCVTGKSITFSERFAESIVIRYGDQFEIATLNTDISYVSYRLGLFIEANTPKTKQPVNIDALRVTAVKNVKKVLKLNNDVVFYDNQKMSFELNLYTPIERKRILALLATVDELVPEVFVDITLNNSTVEQLNALNDRLLEAEVLS